MINLKKILKKSLPFFDLFFCILLFPIGLIMKSYRRIGSARLPRSTKTLRHVGVFPIIKSYYEPLFHTQGLDLERPRLQRILDNKFDLEEQNSFLQKLNFSSELGELNFDFYNKSFESADADFLYQFIRFTKTKNGLGNWWWKINEFNSVCIKAK
jgi:hypothetical protein